MTTNPEPTDWFEDQQRQREDAKRAERKAKAAAAFQQWLPYLHPLANYGETLAVFRRLQQALWDVREQRHATGYQGASYDEPTLAIRVVCDSMADEILAAANQQQDDETIRWVTAGLRCPSQPFCTGCSSCQTVTSPRRPAEKPRSQW